MNRPIPRAWYCDLLVLISLLAAPSAYGATVESEKLLPATTVGYLTVPDPVDLEARWDRTQLGQFFADPTLEPFLENLRDNIPRRLGNMEDRVGVSLDDMQGIASGELAWAIVSRGSQRAASVMLVDTAGNAEKREEVIQKIDAHLMERNSRKSTSEAGGITITSYDVPPDEENENPEPRTAAYFVHQDLLCVADHRGLANELAGRLTGDAGESLSDVSEYNIVMQKCRDEAGDLAPNARWFVKPFPLITALRTIRPRESEGEDRVEQLRQQGFDAIRGVGGFVNVSYDEQHDFLHRTAVYAPPEPGGASDLKYHLGMNILKLPNSNQLQPQNWVPRMIARYTTINIDLLHAFDHVDTVFDEMIAGYEGAFETAMDRFQSDPFGPQIDFRNEIVASLGTRVSMMTDYTLPIEADSERFLAAIEVKPDRIDTLKVAIGKYLKQDGYVQKELEGREIWEFQLDEEEDLNTGLSSGGLFPEEAIEEEEDDRLLTRSAVCVTDGQLFIASDVEFLRLAFKQAAENEALAEAFDYLAVSASLEQFAPDQQSSWSFTRTDETIRPTYAMLRQGRLPESESFFARLLNELLTSPQEQKNRLLREQEIEGGELPSFELARRYFGPSGRSIRSDEDGWFITGVLLNKANY